MSNDERQTASHPPLRCIICGKQPEDVNGTWLARTDAEPGQPYGATTFYSYGQYGSTAFDPEDDGQLQINVCDECLIAKAAVVWWHARYVRQPTLTVFSKPWVPHEHP